MKGPDASILFHFSVLVTVPKASKARGVFLLMCRSGKLTVSFGEATLKFVQQ